MATEAKKEAEDEADEKRINGTRNMLGHVAVAIVIAIAVLTVKLWWYSPPEATGQGSVGSRKVVSTMPLCPDISADTAADWQGCDFANPGNQIVWVAAHTGGAEPCIEPLPSSADYKLWYRELGSSQVKLWSPGVSEVAESYGLQQTPGGYTHQVKYMSRPKGTCP